MNKLNGIPKLILLGVLISSVFILASCRDSYVICGDPPYYQIQLTLVDQNDSLLIGSKYNKDSIRLTVDTDHLVTYIQKGILMIDFAGFEKYNAKDYLLYLSKEDTDTLNMDVDVHYGPCGDPYWVFKVLKYNSKTITPVPGDNKLFKIIK